MAEQSNPEVRRRIKQAQDIDAERREKVEQLAACRSLIQNFATLGEIVGEDEQAAVGYLFPRQFPDWAPDPDAEKDDAAPAAA